MSILKKKKFNFKKWNKCQKMFQKMTEKCQKNLKKLQNLKSLGGEESLIHHLNKM